VTRKVFIYFREKPTSAQIEELRTLDVVMYLDSWIPPVGAHHNGFFLADVPKNARHMVAAKDFVSRVESAERYLQPHKEITLGEV
jgi:hypothetical protein